MTPIFESDIEQLTIELLEERGYRYLTAENRDAERSGFGEVVLADRLRDALARFNPNVSDDAREQAFKQIVNLPSQNLIVNNEAFQKMLTEGIDIEVMGEDGLKGENVRLIDWDTADNNDFVVSNQFTVSENQQTRRPDVVLFVNGLPVVVIELKNALDENATVHKAFTQLQNYKDTIPSLFYYNSVLVASDGWDAKAGTISADWERFSAWKSVDGIKEEKATVPQIETLIKGMLTPGVLLDLMRHFTVFERSQKTDTVTGLSSVVTIKKMAAYHQYFAVNKAVSSTITASAKDGNRKAGVIWHTQGSGKSLSMVFYTGKIVLALHNPTVVVITDRNDLDDQLYDTFAGCRGLLRDEPIQAQCRDDLKRLLKTAGGGIVFTTIQKFSPDDNATVYECLSERENIIVIADEAHRSQYGFKAKHLESKNGEMRTSYGFAKYLRDALPKASFIGFTGTPIERDDASTPAVFGNYIDIYDIEQAIEDGATVKIYYESRLAKVHLKPEERDTLDDEVTAITEGEESTASEKAKAKWTQLEAIVGHRERLAAVAADIVSHFDQRQETNEGKAMVVCMSRRIAAELYDQIIQQRPMWHNSDKKKGAIKVIMTSNSSDPQTWQIHHTTKQERKEIAERFKNPTDILKMVIVCDMWLTGFDVPCLHTMYLDKAMKGHNLMQAIARVNRVFRDKPGGLVVDYIGIATNLKDALAVYTQSGGRGAPTLDQEQAVAVMLEKYEVVCQMFDGFDYQRFFEAETQQKLTVILEAQDFLLGLEKGKERFTREVLALSKAFALSVPHPEAMAIKDEVGLFQAIKTRLAKFDGGSGSGKSDAEIETAIRQIVDKAVVADGILDVFNAAGIKKPDIAILSDDFMAEVRQMAHKNLAIELLKKLLNDEIKVRSRKNLIQGKKLSEMLEEAIRKYQNHLLTAAQVIDELIQLARETRDAGKRSETLGLSEDELAFYDALADNLSAREVLGDKQLAVITVEVFRSVRGDATLDWTLKESVRSRLRKNVKRILKRYGYPPDMQLAATENVIKQAEMLANEWLSTDKQ